MQLVVSSFESVAGLNAATPYTSLASKAVSKHFRCLKHAISDQILRISKALGEELMSTGTINGEITPRLKFIDQGFCKQKASESLGFLEQHQQHIWRPQRGLPERAVTILRAWLFDHFLHPWVLILNPYIGIFLCVWKCKWHMWKTVELVQRMAWCFHLLVCMCELRSPFNCNFTQTHSHYKISDLLNILLVQSFFIFTFAADEFCCVFMNGCMLGACFQVSHWYWQAYVGNSNGSLSKSGDFNITACPLLSFFSLEVTCSDQPWLNFLAKY